MALLAAKAKGLHYPTPLRVVAGLSRLVELAPGLAPGLVGPALTGKADYAPDQEQGQELASSEGVTLRVLDPCAGRGAAARLFTYLISQARHPQFEVPCQGEEGEESGGEAGPPQGQSQSVAQLYTIEIEALRAAQARRVAYRALTANSLNARIEDGAFDVLFHNPPYDDSDDADRRYEHSFLKAFTPRLKPGGLLIHIVPQHRIGLSASFLAENYEELRVYAFPQPEYSLFSQVAVIGRKRRVKKASAAVREGLRAISLQGELAGEDAVEAALGLPVIPCSQDPVWLRGLLAEAGLNPQDYEEVREELATMEQRRQVRGLSERELAEGNSIEFLAGAGAGAGTGAGYLVTTCAPRHQGQGQGQGDPRMQSGDYDPAAALKEARQSGIWQRKALRQAVCEPVQDDKVVRPLLPLRESQAGVLMSIGMLNNMVLTDPAGQRVLIKGRTFKKLHLTRTEKDEKGNIEKEVYNEKIQTEIVSIDLASGAVTKINQAALGDFLLRFKGDIRRQLVEKYPPRYRPGLPIAEQDPQIVRLEAGLPRLLRKPKGAQGIGAVAAAYSLITEGTGILSVEMGGGKSYLAAVAAYLAGMRRAVIVCPPTLVEKWEREIRHTIPGARVEIIGKGGRDYGKLSAVGMLIRAIRRIQAYEAELAAGGQEPGYGATALPPYFIIMAISALRDSGGWKPAVAWRSHRDEEGRRVRVPACPRCGELVRKSSSNQADELASLEDLKRKKYRCQGEVRRWQGASPRNGLRKGYWRLDRCGEPLWQPKAALVGTAPFSRDAQLGPDEGPRKISVAQYLSRYLPGFFDLAILDEAHKFKAAGSGQGISAGKLAESCGKVLCLTGTLAGGKASNLFTLLWRTTNAIRKEFGLHEEGRFIQQYGVVQKTLYREGRGDREEVVEDGALSDRRETRKREVITEKAGLNPAILKLLVPNTVFLKLPDISRDLPPYREEVRRLPMAAEQAEAYHRLEDGLTTAMRAAMQSGSRRFLGAYVRSLLSWPDQPYRAEEVRDPLIPGRIVASAPALSPDTLYPKEVELLGVVREELAAGRKVMVFVSDTDTRDITPRLTSLLQTHTTAQVAVLKSSIDPNKREAWIAGALAKGCNVLVTHPRCVEVGLDLLDFVTIVFLQIEYSTYTMRQASRRSWRIGQKQPIKVLHLVYEETTQVTAIRLMASKIRASLMVEGDIGAGGISELAEEGGSEDLILALARKLIARSGSGSAEATCTEAGAEAEAALSKVATEDADEGGESLERLLQSLTELEQSGDLLLTADEGAALVELAAALSGTETGGAQEPEPEWATLALAPVSASAGAFEPGERVGAGRELVPSPRQAQTPDQPGKRPSLEELKAQLGLLRRAVARSGNGSKSREGSGPSGAGVEQLTMF